MAEQKLHKTGRCGVSSWRIFSTVLITALLISSGSCSLQSGNGCLIVYEMANSRKIFPSLEKAIDFTEVVPISIPRKYSIVPLRPKYNYLKGLLIQRIRIERQ